MFNVAIFNSRHCGCYKLHWLEFSIWMNSWRQIILCEKMIVQLENAVVPKLLFINSVKNFTFYYDLINYRISLKIVARKKQSSNQYHHNQIIILPTFHAQNVTKKKYQFSNIPSTKWVKNKNFKWNCHRTKVNLQSQILWTPCSVPR